MGEMLTYIFSSLRTSERRLDTVSRILRKQKRFNNQVAVFAVVTSLNMAAVCAEQKLQAKRIKQLEKEIEELKHPEGE